MHPWQKAKQWWDENTTGESWEERVGWHLSNGLVFSTNEAFLVAREVRWDGERMHDDGDPNAWFVELAAWNGLMDKGTKGLRDGSAVREFMRVAPRPRQWALWCRHNSFEIKAHDWAKLARKVGL